VLLPGRNCAATLYLARPEEFWQEIIEIVKKTYRRLLELDILILSSVHIYWILGEAVIGGSL